MLPSAIRSLSQRDPVNSSVRSLLFVGLETSPCAWSDSFSWNPKSLQMTYTVCLPLYPCYCSVSKSCLTLCNPMDCSMPGSPVLHYLWEYARIHVHWVWFYLTISSFATPSSPFAFSLSQHQSLFQWVGSLHQVAKVLEFQLQHQSFQWIVRVDFL